MPKGIPKNPEKTRAKRVASLKERWSNPENRAKQSVIQKIVQNRPEMRAAQSERMLGDKNPMKRPEVRAKHKIIMKAIGKRPEVKANRRAAQKVVQKEIHSRPEYLAKLSAANKGENNNMFGIHRFGKDAPNWKGGIPKLPNMYPFGFSKKLKKSIRKRDNNTCQLCGRSKERDGRALCVHHINHDVLDLFELNLITLCRGCNGKVNSRKDFWEDYFTFKLMVCR